jgi:hypothetical protein
MTQANDYNYYGCPLPKMSQETVVLGMCLQMKVMGEDGQISFHEFTTGVTKMEQLGMIESASDTVRLGIMSNGRPGRSRG